MNNIMYLTRVRELDGIIEDQVNMVVRCSEPNLCVADSQPSGRVFYMVRTGLKRERI